MKIKTFSIWIIILGMHYSCTLATSINFDARNAVYHSLYWKIKERERLIERIIQENQYYNDRDKKIIALIAQNLLDFNIRWELFSEVGEGSTTFSLLKQANIRNDSEDYADLAVQVTTNAIVNGGFYIQFLKDMINEHGKNGFNKNRVRKEITNLKDYYCSSNVDCPRCIRAKQVYEITKK